MENKNFTTLSNDNIKKVENKTYLTDEIMKELNEKYEKDNIMNVRQSTHVRYLVAERDKEGKLVLDGNNDPIWLYRKGGFLKYKNLTKVNDSMEGYVILSTRPLNYRGNDALNWSVQVNPYTIFFKIKSKKDNIDKK